MKADARAEAVSRGGYALLLLALLLAWGLRLFRLADKPVWWDEGWSVWLARHDLVSIAVRTASDEHPPLHYWFLSLWNSIAGEDAVVVRFSSVAFGVLSVALLYRFGADLAGRRVALLAAFLLAISRFHIIWSQEIKMYAPGIFLALLSCFAFARLWQTGRRRYAALWALSTWACLMTLYLGILVVAAQVAVALVALARSRRVGQVRFRAWLALQVAVALAYLPWVMVYRQYAYPFVRLDTFDLASALRLYVTVLPLGISTEITRLRFVLAAAGFGLAALVGIYALARRSALWLLPPVAVTSIPLALVAASLPEQAVYQPKVSERYMVVFVPLYLLLVAAGLDWIGRQGRRAALAPAVIAALVMLAALPAYFDSRRPDFEAPALAYAVARQVQPDDTVVLNPDKDWPVYAYYLPLPEDRWLRIPHGAPMTPDEADHWLARLGWDGGAVWLISDPTAAKTDPRGDVRRWLDGRFTKAGEWRFTSAQLTLYTRDAGRTLGVLPVRPPGLAAPPLATVDGMALGALGQPPRIMRRGEMAYLFSVWETLDDSARSHRARVLLINQQTRESRARRWEPLVTAEPEAVLQGGKTVLAKHLLAVGPSQSAGTYDVVLEVEGERQRTAVPVGTLEVVGAPAASAAAPAGPRLATVGGFAALAGSVAAPAQVRPGDVVEAGLRWEALDDTATNYTVFVHLVGPDGVVWGTGDSQPAGGALPTSGWAAGDVIEDLHRMWLPAETPPGQYMLLVGLYDAQTGERLTAVGPNGLPFAGDAVPAGSVTVLP